VKSKILLVDDDPYTQQLFEGLLRSDDVELRVAGNIAEARKEFDSADFNLILLDQRLPDGNGLDFFKEIRALRAQQVVILITGHADLRDAIGAVRGGVFDYLTKPFKNLDELTAIIGRALEMDRAYRESRGAIGGDAKATSAATANRASGHHGVDRGRERDGQGTRCPANS